MSERRITGTEYYAQRITAPVRTYRIVDGEGRVLGTASAHGSQPGFVRAGYHLGTAAYDPCRHEAFDNLYEVATALAASKEA